MTHVNKTTFLSNIGGVCIRDWFLCVKKMKLLDSNKDCKTRGCVYWELNEFSA